MALHSFGVKFFGPVKSIWQPCVRGIAGKATRIVEDKPKPFPYETRPYNLFWAVVDKTSLRFDENSKLIIVDGAHAVGKTQFGQELAEELDMKFVPYPRMDWFLIDSYGNDLRKYNEYFPDRWKTYDEKDFSRNPLGPVAGCADRFHFYIFKQKYFQYIAAIRHIFNTGQGVVMEGSPFSDHAFFNAAYNAGWIAPETRHVYKNMYRLCTLHLMRPNLLIYLDAPTDVVQKKIADRNNEWDKNSPVWSNKQYLNDIYNEFKKTYLKEQQAHSRVLVYDWSEPGDTEIVVDDIEELEFDNIEFYDDQQKDWRLFDDEGLQRKRWEYTNHGEVLFKMNVLADISERFMVSADHLMFYTEENQKMEHIWEWIDSQRYTPGFNPQMGDKNVWRKWSGRKQTVNFEAFRYYWPHYPSRPQYLFTEDVKGI